MSVHQLVYISEESTASSPTDLLKILKTSRANNAIQNITGILLYDAGRYFQVLEGVEEAITRLFRNISQDDRHSNVKLLYLEKAPARLFPNWTMNMFNLNENRDKDLTELKKILSQVDRKESVSADPIVLQLIAAFEEAS
ncbi:MAG: hypothetical protein ACI9TP_001373 [Candidatus Azotimanducaceae bacterium]|jgi:hypothetical protein